MRSKNKPSFTCCGSNQSESENEPPHSIEAGARHTWVNAELAQESNCECAGKISRKHFFLYRAQNDLFSPHRALDAAETYLTGRFHPNTPRPKSYSTLSAVQRWSRVCSRSFRAADQRFRTNIELVRDKYNLRHIIAASAESARRACEETEDIPNLARYLSSRSYQIQNSHGGAGKLPRSDAALLNGAKWGGGDQRLAASHQQNFAPSSKMIIGGSTKGRKTLGSLDLRNLIWRRPGNGGFWLHRGAVCLHQF
jgi:hypothetical protein